MAVIFQVAAIAIYFTLARKFNILDKPNERSSHNNITIRGAGILFPLSILFYSAFSLSNYYFVSGLILVSIVGIIDDLRGLNNTIRFVIYAFASWLLFIETDLLSIQLAPYLLGAILILCVGIMNAFNFMDGINGITGLFSIVTLLTLQYINIFYDKFIAPEFIWTITIALFIFLFFNLRKKAICFAGDVGSISIAFVIIFLLLKLIIQTGNLYYIFFLSVYGVDSVLTIISRLLKKENIFKAHRSHFYQVWVNEAGWSHITVSFMYAILQLIINIAIIKLIEYSYHTFYTLLVVNLFLCLIYITLKPRFSKLKI